jgi:hypothetical protein
MTKSTQKHYRYSLCLLKMKEKLTKKNQFKNCQLFLGRDYLNLL